MNIYLFGKGNFPEFTELKNANKKCQDADQAYAKQMTLALSHPLEMWSRTLDPSLLPRMAEIFKCSQTITQTINENIKNTQTAFGGLQELVGLRKEFEPIKQANEKIVRQATDAANRVAKAEKILNDLQLSNAPATQIAKAEKEHNAAVEAERSANAVAESSSAEFLSKFNDYQQKFVSTLAASYCEASTARANAATTLAEIGLQIQTLADEMPLEAESTSVDANLLAEIERLKPLLATPSDLEKAPQTNEQTNENPAQYSTATNDNANEAENDDINNAETPEETQHNE